MRIVIFGANGPTGRLLTRDNPSLLSMVLREARK